MLNFSSPFFPSTKIGRAPKIATTELSPVANLIFRFLSHKFDKIRVYCAIAIISS